MEFEIENGVLKKYRGNGGAVAIPKGVTSIGYRAFYRCSSLTSVTIPEGVISIGEWAFEDCSSLTSVTIPKSVTSIESYAFSGTPWLKNYPDDFVIGGKILIQYKGNAKSVTIPEGVTSIGGSAFEDCRSLTSVTIPEGVTSIGNRAFSKCSSLTSVTIPEGVTSIGYWAFEDCSCLTSVTIPEGVTSIGDRAFSECSSLTNVTIPKSVTSIEDNTFYNCRSLTSITYHGETFNLYGTGDVSINEILSMLAKKDYAVKMYSPVKYGVIWGAFCANPDDEEIFAYVKKNFAKMFKFLIDKEETATIQKVLDTGKLITKKNIDKNIQYAIDNKKYQSQVMLTNYKAQNNWYPEDTEKAIMKKFKL